MPQAGFESAQNLDSNSVNFFDTIILCSNLEGRLLHRARTFLSVSRSFGINRHLLSRVLFSQNPVEKLDCQEHNKQ